MDRYVCTWRGEVLFYLYVGGILVGYFAFLLDSDMYMECLRG